MKLLSISCYWFSMLIFSTALMAKGENSLGHFEAFRITWNGVGYPMVVYYPADFSEKSKKGARWPAVLFLHGSGERGSDGLKQCSVGIGPFIAKNPHLFDALVIFPQIPQTMNWSLEGGLLVAMAALEMVCANFFINPEQIYLTGLSMGGAGAWILAENFPEMFAAVIPIAAAVSVTEKTPLLRNTPIWAFQSADDEICPPEEGVKARIELLKSLDHANIRYTEYESADEEPQDWLCSHRLTWEKAYQNQELYQWLFSQRLADERL